MASYLLVGMPLSSIETLSTFNCALKNSGLCSSSNDNVVCGKDLPKCSQNDPCPTDNSQVLNSDYNESSQLSVPLIAIIATFASLVVFGYIILQLWTIFQSKVLNPKLLTF